MPDRPIGIFDSGLGGLTVARAVIEVLPHESIVYFGDTARFPYGTKSLEQVKANADATAWSLSADTLAEVERCLTLDAGS